MTLPQKQHEYSRRPGAGPTPFPRHLDDTMAQLLSQLRAHTASHIYGHSLTATKIYSPVLTSEWSPLCSHLPPFPPSHGGSHLRLLFVPVVVSALSQTSAASAHDAATARGRLPLVSSAVLLQVKEGGRKSVARDADGSHTASASSVANSSPLSLSSGDVAELEAIVGQCAALPQAGTWLWYFSFLRRCAYFLVPR
jgi:hypothetical protein